MGLFDIFNKKMNRKSGNIIDKRLPKFPKSEKEIILYSGLLLDQKEIVISKLQNVPKYVADKILELPQYEIFFCGYKGYYRDSINMAVRELPRGEDGGYYDPVCDTEAYNLVIHEVKNLARHKYEELMMRQFGTTSVFGGCHTYYRIEASILFEKYCITCINHPSDLNMGLFLD